MRTLVAAHLRAVLFLVRWLFSRQSFLHQKDLLMLFPLQLKFMIHLGTEAN